jgi:hypothetical protein
MPKAKRKKDPQTYVLRELTEDLLDIVEIYHVRLQEELEILRAQSGPEARIKTIEEQINQVEALEQLVDKEVWDLVRSLGNGSAYVEHARTGDYF